MSTITKEWLQQKIADMEATRDEIPFGLDEDDSNTLAAMKLALASLEAEPVAYADPQAFRNFQAGVARREWMWRNPGEDLIAVYTAPPAPVSVPLAIRDEDFEKALSLLNDTLDDCGDSERGLFLALDKAGIEVRSDVCRDAMLHGADGNSPVIPDGWKLVPVELAPEQIRAVQLNSELGAYAAANLTGAYSLFREFWDVAIAAAPQQEAE